MKQSNNKNCIKEHSLINCAIHTGSVFNFSASASVTSLSVIQKNFSIVCYFIFLCIYNFKTQFYLIKNQQSRGGLLIENFYVRYCHFNTCTYVHKLLQYSVTKRQHNVVIQADTFIYI